MVSFSPYQQTSSRQAGQPKPGVAQLKSQGQLSIFGNAFCELVGEAVLLLLFYMLL